MDEGTMLGYAWGVIVSLAIGAVGLFSKLLHSRMDSTNEDVAALKKSADDLWKHHDEKMQRMVRVESKVDSLEKTADERQRGIETRLDRIDKKLDTLLQRRRADESGA